MRHDIVVTVLSSIALVGAVFFIGFRRWLPLLGMGFSLLLCCLIGLAVGLLIFHRDDHGRLLHDSGRPGHRFHDSYLQTLSAVTKTRGARHGIAIANAVHPRLDHAVFLSTLTNSGFLPSTRLRSFLQVHPTSRL